MQVLKPEVYDLTRNSTIVIGKSGKGSESKKQIRHCTSIVLLSIKKAASKY